MWLFKSKVKNKEGQNDTGGVITHDFYDLWAVKMLHETGGEGEGKGEVGVEVDVDAIIS